MLLRVTLEGLRDQELREWRDDSSHGIHHVLLSDVKPTGVGTHVGPHFFDRYEEIAVLLRMRQHHDGWIEGVCMTYRSIK